jgi:DUF3025 family protein
VRVWLDGERSLERLNRHAETAGIQTESGRPVRFVPPGKADAYYELRVFESGCVSTRPGNLHDLFNAAAWLAFPRSKARINAMHAARLPLENGRRGRLRDLLTLFDEGGAIVACDDAQLIGLLRGAQWRTLFWEQRSRVLAAMRVLVLGHAVLEQALKPWPGITCKALILPSAADADAQTAAWLAGLPDNATPRALASLPIYGYPGWFPGNERAQFYDDQRYFRPSRP